MIKYKAFIRFLLGVLLIFVVLNSGRFIDNLQVQLVFNTVFLLIAIFFLFFSTRNDKISFREQLDKMDKVYKILLLLAICIGVLAGIILSIAFYY